MNSNKLQSIYFRFGVEMLAGHVYSEQSDGYIVKADNYYLNVVVNLADFNHDDMVELNVFKKATETYLSEAFKYI